MTVLDKFVKIPVVVGTLADSVLFGAAELALLRLLEDPRQLWNPSWPPTRSARA